MARSWRVVAEVAITVLLGAAAASAAPEETDFRAWSATATAGWEIDRGIGDDTDLEYLPFSLRLDYRSFSFTLATSWLQIDGPNLAGDVVLRPAIQDFLDARSLTLADIVDTGPFDSSASGVGDTLATLAWAWADPQGYWPYVELDVTLKIPTADEDRLLGTGHFDGIFGLEIAKTFGRVTPFASASYRLYGGPLVLPAIHFTGPMGQPLTIPEEKVTLRNSFSATLGVSARAHDRVQLGLMYDWIESPVRGIGDVHELVPFLSIRIFERIRLGPYFVFGLSHEAPEIGYATQLIVTY